MKFNNIGLRINHFTIICIFTLCFALMLTATSYAATEMLVNPSRNDIVYNPIKFNKINYFDKSLDKNNVEVSSGAKFKEYNSGFLSWFVGNSVMVVFPDNQKGQYIKLHYNQKNGIGQIDHRNVGADVTITLTGQSGGENGNSVIVCGDFFSPHGDNHDTIYNQMPVEIGIELFYMDTGEKINLSKAWVSQKSINKDEWVSCVKPEDIEATQVLYNTSMAKYPAQGEYAYKGTEKSTSYNGNDNMYVLQMKNDKMRYITSSPGSIGFSPITASYPSLPEKCIVDLGKELKSTTAKVNSKLTFRIKQQTEVLGVTGDQRYSEFSITDKLPAGLKYAGAKLYFIDGNTNAKSEVNADDYNLTDKDGLITAKLTDKYLKVMPLNGGTYLLEISTVVDSSANGRSLTNQGFTTINNKKIQSNNTVITVDKTFRITTSVINGKISESLTVNKGESKTISYTPNSGYQLKTVEVDGQVVSPGENLSDYTFTDISCDHKIDVEYEKIPKLQVIKTADKTDYNAGDIITYNVIVKQTEDGATARDVLVEDKMPEGIILNPESIKGEGITVISSDENGFKLKAGDLGEKVITYTAITEKKVSKKDLINIVTAQGKNNTGIATDKASVNTHVLNPTITKTVDKNEAKYGDVLTYTITIDTGDPKAILHNAKIADENLSKNLEFIEFVDLETLRSHGAVPGMISMTANDKESDEWQATLNLGDIQGKHVVQYKARVKAKSGIVSNRASLTGDELEYPLTYTVETKILEPELNFEKKADKKNVFIGDTVTFTITCNMNNDIPAKNVDVTDTVPAEFEVIDVNTNTGKVTSDKNSLNVHVDEVTKGNPLTVTIKAKAVKEGAVVNTASIKGENLLEPKESEVQVQIDKKPEPAIIKSNPKTGEANNVALPLLFTAIAVAAGIITMLRRHKNDISK